MADAPSAEDLLKPVRLLALDVDGVLTNGRILLIGDSETKRFHVADGLGLQLLLHAGILVAWISGRTSPAVARRAAELGITHLYEGVSNKAAPLAELMAQHALQQANIAYMGDDLNDLPAFSLAGVKFAPSDAVLEIKALAHFVTERPGGAGAVREACDVILKSQGRWNEAVTIYLAKLLQTPHNS